MKTLKQIWIESVTAVPNDCPSFSKWLEKCLEWTIKEWLTQDFIFYSRPDHSIGILAYLDGKIKELS